MLEDIAGLFDLLPTNDASFLTGLGLQVGGTALKAQQLKRIRDSQDAAVAAAKARQAGYQAQANKVSADAISNFSAPAQEQQRQQLQSQYEKTFTPGVKETADAAWVPGNPGAPKVIQDGVADQMTRAIAKGKQRAGSNATLSSYSGQGVRNNIALNRVGQDIGQLQDFSAGTAGILPYQLQSANLRGRGAGIGSDLMSGLGDLFVMNALRKKPQQPLRDWTSGNDW